MKDIKKALLAASGVLLASFLASSGPDKEPPSNGELDRKTLTEIFNHVVESHVSKPDPSALPAPETLDSQSLKKMLASLDPHSAYLNPQQYQDLKQSIRGNEFGGLGIEVMLDEETGFVKIIAPIEGTPAQKAGIQAGDLISRINGKSVKGMELHDAVDLMRGEVGENITITIRRGEENARDYTLTRELIKVSPVKSKIIDGNIGYVKISTFDENTHRTLIEKIDEIKRQIGDNAQGYIIDLRNNPGGLLGQAINVSDVFLDEGRIVSVGSGAPDDLKHIAHWGDEIRDKPVIVLTNEGSASASEIVAGALQDHRRAIILGTRSFGKGSVQTIYPLRNGGGLKLTTQLYFTPSGDSIQGRGITPDILYVSPDGGSTKNRRSEASLEGTITNPETGQDNHRTTDTCTAEDNVKIVEVGRNALLANGKPDFQLLCAVDNLRGTNKFTVTQPVPAQELVPKG